MKKEVEVLKKKGSSLDFGMVVITLILLGIGLVMVASASSYHSLINYGDSNHLFVRQAFFAILGLVAMTVVSFIDYRKYKKFTWFIYLFAVILLILVITPLGVTRNGAKRWLGVGELFQFQPSEIMKPVLVMVIAAFLSKNSKRLSDYRTYIVPTILILIVGILMYFQKHMSGLLVIGVGAISVIFTSGIKLKPKAVIAAILLIVLAGVAFIFSDDFRLQRIFSFLNPEQDIQDGNWQAVQSLYAIGSGGLFGRGLGQSRQKYLWLPEAQNDFIFSIVGEELGFVGAAVVLGLFAIFIFKGYKIAMTCKDLYGSLIAAGITSIFAVQILINVAVVTCSMPVTGMPLPFFSYGGTSLAINLLSMGVLLNISKNCNNVVKE